MRIYEEIMIFYKLKAISGQTEKNLAQRLDGNKERKIESRRHRRRRFVNAAKKFRLKFTTKTNLLMYIFVVVCNFSSKN
jgi:hypothetical protein